jgi:HlyD family secretion protein
MKRFVIIVVVVAVIAAGGYYLLQRGQQQRQQAQLADLQTVAVERGPLTASIGATGTVRANQSALLNWQTSGTVESIYVQAGEQVETNQDLAELQKNSLSQNIILAEADLIDAQKALDDLLEPASQLALAQAQQAIVDAEKQVEDAQTRLNSLKTTADQADIDSAQATVIILRDQLDKAQKDFRPYENKAEDNLVRANLQAALSRAQQNYDNAVTRLNNLKGTASATDLSIAEANLEVAKASLEDARQKYDDLVSGAAQEDVLRLQTRIAAIEATLKLPKIVAPFNGTITRVNTKVGDQVGPGTPAFRLDDLSHLLVDVGVTEIDINRIAPGQDATLQFDGIPDKTYDGVVVEVDSVGTTNQGVVEFQVKIEISDPDEAVKPGMTAAVNIVVDQLQDVLIIPNRAVRVLNGDRVVYILSNGQLSPVNITLGVSSDTMSEVLNSDLKVGDQVVLNPPQNFEVGGGPPPFVNQ